MMRRAFEVIQGSMFHLRTKEHSLPQAALQDDAPVLDTMLCQEMYKRILNCRGGWGPSPLHAVMGRLGRVRVLLTHGALEDGPLFTAAWGKGHVLLRAEGSPPPSPVLTAAREGDADVLRILLQYGAEVNHCSKVLILSSVVKVCGGPLYLAAVYGHVDCFRLLLLHGADPDYNCVDAAVLASIKQPKTVLEMCLRHGCGVEYVQLLIDFGANVYLPTLIIEKSTKQNEAVELLLRERGTPKTLSSQCRLTLRRHLQKINKINCIEQLDVPKSLIHFLQHKPPPVHRF